MQNLFIYNGIEYIRNKSIESRSKNPFKNDDLRLSTYMTLKSLYDKWLCSPQYGPIETWSLNRKEQGRGDFNNFIYTDAYYHDIGDLFTVNVNPSFENDLFTFVTLSSILSF